MRSVMFTIFKHFGFEGENSNGFKGVRFVLNDKSAAVLARNILFLYLCVNMPEDELKQKEWIASVWSLWYNHELLPQHDALLFQALQQLIQWSCNWQEWSNCPLGMIVQFSSPATFAKIKKVWYQWNSRCLGKSVDEVKKERGDFQSHHMKPMRGYYKNREACLKEVAYEDFNNYVMMNSTCMYFLHPQETVTTMENEYLHYLTEGTVWAESILDIPISNLKEVKVNPTLFEREDGMYTLQYCLTPYVGFMHSFQYTHAEIGKTLGKRSSLLKYFPVADTYFKPMPLLANSVQQFAMWLRATSHLIKKSSGGKSKVSILFDLDDSLDLCCYMHHHPESEMYTKFGVQFDAIYTSNLLDHVSPPALILSALPLLKPRGTLFTSTFKTPALTAKKYLEEMFGFSPELFPVFLGIHCVGHDGNFSSAVNPRPYPIANISVSSHIFFSWRYIESQPLVLEESPHATKSLLNLCSRNCTLWILCRGSVDIFLCVLRQFLKQFQSLPSPHHPFLVSLCSAIQTTPELKPYLLQLQTQALLHGMHLHITLTEDDCPICGGQPLESYIQQFSLTLGTEIKMGMYEAPAFVISLTKHSRELAFVSSIAVDISDLKQQLVFFLPRNCLFHYDVLEVEMIKGLNGECILLGTMDCLRSSSVQFLFLKDPLQPHISEIHALGEIVKHIGNGSTFETVISMNETYQTMNVSKLKVTCPECNQLKISYGANESNIVYPYPIDESKVHVKVSKKKSTISVMVQRDSSVFYKEQPLYHVDPSNKLILPKFHCGTEVIEKYCKQQVLFNAPDNPLFNAKRSFMELFQHALSGQKYFTLSFPSKRLRDSSDVYALVYVHDVRFSPVFTTPALDVSYCFLDTKPAHLTPEFRAMHNCLGRTWNIMVDDAEYKFLKGAFSFFSTVTQCALSTEKHTVTLPVQKHKLWKHFDQAVLFPLYPNPANPTYQKCHSFVTTTSMKIPANMSPSQDQFAKLVGEGTINACSFCSQAVTMIMKKCGRCNKAMYCSEECQRMHWMMVHGLVCSASEQKESAAAKAKEESTTSPQQDPFLSSSLLANSQIASDSSTMGGVREHVSDEFEDDISSETATVSDTCMRCRKPATINCSCGSVSYCSIACQTLEWPRHSEKCTGQENAATPIDISSSSKNEPNNGDSKKLTSHVGNSDSEHSEKFKQVSSAQNSSKQSENPSSRSSIKAPPEHDGSKTETTNYEIPKCSNCGKMASSLKHCSKCRNVLYCSVECQRLHWPQHKSICTAVKK